MYKFLSAITNPTRKKIFMAGRNGITNILNAINKNLRERKRVLKLILF